MTSELDGRRILVTGATSGIGEATARALIDEGASVALAARSADDVAALASRLGERAQQAPCDVTDPQSVDRAVGAAVDSLGGLDAVICSAGVFRPGGITSSGPDDWRAMFEVNVLGVLNTVSAALDSLRAADHADVVILSSMSGRRRPSVELGFYSASKFAVHVLSDSLHEELAPLGVRVSIVSPGFVNTPIFDQLADEGQRAMYQAAAAAEGLDPGAVAAQILHQLRQPPGVDLFEIAMLSP
jgi:NADP-dependent 3-hydroxy acid dehydrogenase YdfG